MSTSIVARILADRPARRDGPVPAGDAAGGAQDDQADFKPGRVVIDGELIESVEFGDFAQADYYLPEAYLGPGLIDLQINGALGRDFTTEPEAVEAAAEWLPCTGVTGFLPTAITAPFDVLRRALGILGHAQPAGAQVLGVHLEGPFIDPAHRGAHDAGGIRAASPEDMGRLFVPALRIVTLAPELPGAPGLVRWLKQRGIVASAGHSGASWQQAIDGFEAGIGWVTHLFNAQAPLHHRSPGLAGAALARPDLPVGLIADGLHVHPAMCQLVYRCKGPAGITLVTDAVAALGLGPGEFRLAGQRIRVEGGVARLAGSDTMAGSILTLNAAIRNMMRFAGASRADAWQMASTTPARLLGLADRGAVRPGAVADLAVMSAALEPVLTVRAGQVVFAA